MVAVSLRERALVGVVERAAHSMHSERLLLRGGLAIREFVRPVPRPIDDVDFLGLGPLDADSAQPVAADLLAVEIGDGLVYSAPTFEVIWAETEHPGLRVRTFAECGTSRSEEAVAVQIDIGFGDPRVADDVCLQVAGVTRTVPTVAVETLLAWKIHGLFERGRGRWRAKDLYDVVLLGSSPELDRAVLPECLRVAFESYGHDLAMMHRFLHGSWGQSRASRRKWKSFCAERRSEPSAVCIPTDLASVIARARTIVAAIAEPGTH